MLPGVPLALIITCGDLFGHIPMKYHLHQFYRPCGTGPVMYQITSKCKITRFYKPITAAGRCWRISTHVIIHHSRSILLLHCGVGQRCTQIPAKIWCTTRFYSLEFFLAKFEESSFCLIIQI